MGGFGVHLLQRDACVRFIHLHRELRADALDLGGMGGEDAAPQLWGPPPNGAAAAPNPPRFGPTRTVRSCRMDLSCSQAKA